MPDRSSLVEARNLDVLALRARAQRASEAGKGTVKITPERLLALTTALLAVGVKHVGMQP